MIADAPPLQMTTPPAGLVTEPPTLPLPPPRITYLGYVGETGGDGVQAFELARHVARRGSHVTLIVPSLPGLRQKADAHADCPNLRVICTPLIRYDTIAQNPLDVFRLLWPLRNDPIIHLQVGDICPPRVSLLVLDILRPRALFATIHAASPEMPVGSPRAAYWASIVRRRFRAVFCPSQQGSVTQNTYGLPQEKTRTIYTGVDTVASASGNGAVARAELGVAPDVPLLLFISRLHPQKCPLDALHAFTHAAEVLPNLHFALVGTGPLEAEVKQAASVLPCRDRIHFAPPVSNVPDYLAACDVWLLPSEAENFSRAVLEALAAGCAVVATNCRGNDEVLVHEENSLLAPVGDVPGLSYAIVRFLSDAPLRARLQKAGKETAARFALEIAIDNYQRAYADFGGEKA